MASILRKFPVFTLWFFTTCTTITVADSLPITDSDGFQFAVPGRKLQFPRDHGSHPHFKTEWWYITGHLHNDDRSIDLGFQLTFFRSASRESKSREVSQLYLAHAAITNKTTGQFYHEERLNTDDWNADAATEGLDLYNGNWSLRMTDSTTEKMQARFSLSDVGICEFTFNPSKPKTLFGRDGYSKKGDRAGAASYYITFTRLRAAGTLKNKQGEKSQLTGVAWMDHEFSSSQLSPEQVGWNWTSLILDDGSELMAYVMRRNDQTIDPHSRLTLISPTGEKTEFLGDGFSWDPIRYWTSPSSKARYPVEYEIKWASNGTPHKIRVTPFIDQQELNGKIADFVYWEGASKAFNEDGKEIGLGYTELTGYSESLYGKF